MSEDPASSTADIPLISNASLATLESASEHQSAQVQPHIGVMPCNAVVSSFLLSDDGVDTSVCSVASADSLHFSYESPAPLVAATGASGCEHTMQASRAPSPPSPNADQGVVLHSAAYDLRV